MFYFVLCICLQCGFVIIEVFGVLVIGLMILLGLVYLIDDFIDDFKGMQIVYYQLQISVVVMKYFSINNQFL